MRRGLPALVFAVALMLPAPASAAIDTVFGSIACAPRDGVRFCEGSNATRVRTFDDVPLDTNVTLPPAGDGNFPLVVSLHGYGGQKSGLDDAAKRFASRGYAVLSFTARGFHGSCGTPPNRNDPVCLQRGWLRLADSRFEVRDTQHLAGLLADEGVIDPQRIGVTGVSYGGGQSVQLAVLRDRIRMPDGSYVPWLSPSGRPMRIAAAAPVIPWSDLVYSLVPNGRTLDYTITGDQDDLRPIGVLKTSFVSGFYSLGQASGFYAPPGLDPQADLTNWFVRVNAGEPYDGDPVTEGIVREIAANHSGYYLAMDRAPAPTLISNGFTDDIFPVDEAVRYANKVKAHFPSATVAQLHFDYGHQRGQNKPADTARLAAAIDAWFDRHVKGSPAPTVTGAQALTQTCPKGEPSGGPFRASSWLGLSRGEVSFVERGAKTVLSGPRDPQVDRAVDPIAAGNNPCSSTSAADQQGTATYRLPKADAGGYTLLGSPTVIADLTVTGPHAAVVGRVWDVKPDGAGQTLVARGVYRPAASGRQVFQMHPNGWRFAAGHTPKLELLGAEVPAGRVPNGQYSVAVSNLELRLPTADRPGAPGASSQVSPRQPFVLPRGATPVAGIRTVPIAASRPRRARSRVVLRARGRVLRGRYRILVRGRLARRAGRTRRASDCRGRVTVAIRTQGRRVVRRSARVRNGCRFTRRVGFRRGRLSHSQRRSRVRPRVRAHARFRGNVELRPSRRSAPVRLRASR